MLKVGIRFAQPRFRRIVSNQEVMQPFLIRQGSQDTGAGELRQGRTRPLPLWRQPGGSVAAGDPRPAVEDRPFILRAEGGRDSDGKTNTSSPQP